MTFTQKTWVTGDTITADELNRLENGIKDSISFEDWAGGESVTLDTSVTPPPDTPDTTPPVLSITTGGTFTGTKIVSMSTNEASTIYYTLDGTNPTTGSAVYSSTLSITATTTLKAFARDTAGNQSGILAVTYTLDTSGTADTTPPVLTITPAGTFTDTKTVTMSANETATIWYTLDDTDPVTSGTKLQYSAPLTLTATDTIKAYAVDSANNASTVQTVTYTKQAAPTADITTDGLMFWYDGRDGSGTQTNIPDRNNLYPATWYAPTFNATTGWYKKGIKITKDWGGIVNTTATITSKSYTLEHYVDFNAVPVANQTLIAQRIATANESFVINHTDSTQNLYFKRIRPAGGTVSQKILSNYNLDQIYHIVLVATEIDATTMNYKAYVDGVKTLDVNETYNVALTPTNIITYGNATDLGHRANLTLYSARTYSRALTEAEILKNRAYEQTVTRA